MCRCQCFVQLICTNLNYKILVQDDFSLLLALWLEVKGSHTEGEMSPTLREEARPHCRMGRFVQTSWRVQSAAYVIGAPCNCRGWLAF